MVKRDRWITNDTDALFAAILKLKNLDEARRFFRDLMAEREIAEFSNRWKAARMLNQKIPYVTIAKETGLSSTTIARVQKWLTGDLGGYRTIINRLHHSNSIRLRGGLS